MLKSLSTAALEGKEVLFWTNSFFYKKTLYQQKNYHLSFSLVVMIESLLSLLLLFDVP